MLYKSIFTEIKADTDQNIISGHGSYFSNVDSHKDIVMPGAFTKTLEENRNRIKILWQHDVFEPIGKPLTIYEDSKGLFFEAKISQTDKGKQAMQLIKDGVLTELSIGYDPIKHEWDSKQEARLLKEVKLYEISVVTWASNDMAQINGYKSIQNLIEEIKVGRTISGRNKDTIQLAIDALLALIADEPSPTDEIETDGCGGTRKPNKTLEYIESFDPDIYQSILEEIKKYK